MKKKFYKKVFSTLFNLHFKPPSVCKLCYDISIKHSTENDENPRKSLKTEKELNFRKAKQSREKINTDKSKDSDETYCFSFDLQKTFLFPKLSSSIAYYSRNLYVYNFGVHSFNNNVGHMYVRDEIERGRGSHDLAARHLTEKASIKNYSIFWMSIVAKIRNVS